MAKVHYNSFSYREKRPVDILNPPQINGQRPSLAGLPESWQVALTEAEEWPFVDPDEHGLADPDPDFGEYPSEPSLLPAGIDPFTEDEPWGMMLTETPRQYELFSYYRSEGITRTIKATAEHFDLSRVYVTNIASQKNWQQRVRAWDDYRERVYTAELLMGVKEMAHEHAEIARDGIRALSIAFEGIAAGIKGDEAREEFLAEIADLPVKTQLALAQGSARVIPNLMNAERLSRGLPTEISHGLLLTETRVTVQTTDDLFDILTGLAGPLSVAQSEPIEGEVVEADS